MPDVEQSAGDTAPGGATSEVARGVDSVSDNIRSVIENPSIDNAVDVLLPMLLDLGRTIIILLAIAVVAAIVGRWVGRICRRLLKPTHLDETLSSFFVRLSTYAIWILAVPVAFAAVGIEATSIAAVIGAAGLAIGLGLQGALSNVSAGVMLLLLRPIRIDDLVEVQDVAGRVEDIGLFYTTIVTWEQETVTVPNSEVFSNKITNYTARDSRRVDIPVGVAYGTDLAEAKEAILAALKRVDSRHDSYEPAAYLTSFGDSSINYEAQVHAPSRDFLTVRHEAVLKINAELAARDIEIPYPQRTMSGVLTIDERGPNKDDTPRNDS